MNYLNILLACLACLLVFAQTNAQDKDYFNKYEGSVVYLVKPKNIKELNSLSILQAEERFNFWNDVRAINKPVNIMVENNKKNELENILNSLNINFEIVIDNVADSIKNQYDFKRTYKKLNNLKDFDYGKYHQLNEINDWIDQLAQEYPNYVSIFNVTRSFENRYLKAFKISIPSASTKKAFWFDGGIHAREWISPATVIYIAYSLLSKYGNDQSVTEILNTFDFYILPVFNVDGYVYTFTNDRLWRKTRSKSRLDPCYGVDPNRNWDDHWCEGGASRDPCSDSYCGPKAFSEIEVKGVADFLGKNNDSIICYINFHSYSQLWMSPWGYTTKTPANYTLQDNGSIKAVTALASLYNTQYDHGNIGETIYIASGNSADWTYDVANIFFSYAVELRDQGQSGFLLPEDQIIPSGLETFEAVKALAFYIKSNI